VSHDPSFGGRARLRPPKSLPLAMLAVTFALSGLGLGIAAATSSGWSRSTYLDRNPQTTRTPAATGPRIPISSHPRLRRQMPVPVRISVPVINVNAPLVALGRNADGSAKVPRSFGVAGWFRPGPEPGERGAAVILGHVDSKSGPGVFYRLKALRRGDRILIRLRTGELLPFTVTGAREASKHRFPTRLVYAHTGPPTLRLVTCGGSFNSASGHYIDNYIVFARLDA
jgi:hypothetical protein